MTKPTELKQAVAIEIYSTCHELLDCLETAMVSLAVAPERSTAVASDFIHPIAKRLADCLSESGHLLIMWLKTEKPVLVLGKDGATALHALLTFARRVTHVCSWLSAEIIRRDVLRPLRDGLNRARSFLQLEEARLGISAASIQNPKPHRTGGVSPAGIGLTRAEIADALGISEDRVRGWTRRQEDPLKPVGKRGNRPLFLLEDAKRILRGELPES